LVNGSTTKEFNPTRGLRQGDPITPFLFLIVAQSLFGMVNQVAWLQAYTRIEIWDNKIKVNLLQFGNDTLFLCEVNNQNILAIKSMLKCFEMDLGLCLTKVFANILNYYIIEVSFLAAND